MMSFNQIACFAFSILLVTWLGCRYGNQSAESTLAFGRIMVQQEPAAGVVVKLVPAPETENGSQIQSDPTSLGDITDQQGNFEIRFNTAHPPNPGVKYALICYWLDSLPEGGLSADLFNGKYLSTENPVKTLEWAGEPIDLGIIPLEP